MPPAAEILSWFCGWLRKHRERRGGLCADQVADGLVEQPDQPRDALVLLDGVLVGRAAAQSAAIAPAAHLRASSSSSLSSATSGLIAPVSATPFCVSGWLVQRAHSARAPSALVRGSFSLLSRLTSGETAPSERICVWLRREERAMSESTARRSLRGGGAGGQHRHERPDAVGRSHGLDRVIGGGEVREHRRRQLLRFDGGAAPPRSCTTSRGWRPPWRWPRSCRSRARASAAAR